MVDYEQILAAFGEEKVTSRYKFIHDKMLEYLNEKSLVKAVSIDKSLLKQAVMDYFTDIYRTKDFHEIDLANAYKIYGYLAYWLLRRKPLQIVPGNSDVSLAFINEGFVTILLAHELLLPDPVVPFSKKAEEVLEPFIDQLFYHLKYRPLDKQSLELMLFAYQTGRDVNIANEAPDAKF